MDDAASGATTRDRWLTWAANQNLPADQAADLALEALEGGASASAAAAAARLGSGFSSPQDVMQLRAELAWVESVIADLGLHQAPEELLLHYRRRRDLFIGALSHPPAAAGAPRPAIAQLTGPTARPSLREFVGEHSILILSYVGAFLLIVATVLFELYGVTGLPGSARFGAVLALDLAFGAAGRTCLRSIRLRLVGQTYIAIFALMAPLTGVAAYVFLDLGAAGVSRDQAVGAIGLSSAAIYAILAVRIESRGYAALSLASLLVGLLGVVNALHLGDWRPAGFALLVPVYVLAAHAGRRRDVFSRVAEPFIHFAAVFAILWAFEASISSTAGCTPGPGWTTWPGSSSRLEAIGSITSLA